MTERQTDTQDTNKQDQMRHTSIDRHRRPERERDRGRQIYRQTQEYTQTNGQADCSEAKQTHARTHTHKGRKVQKYWQTHTHKHAQRQGTNTQKQDRKR